MPQKLIDLTGQIFGRLKVLEHFKIVDRSGKRVRTKWRCKCECGNITDVAGSSLRSGNTKSCGCLHKEKMSILKKIHGLRHSSEYYSWSAMRSRCSNPKNIRYKNYGGRGIKVCDEWLNDFVQYYKDMGPKPSPKHSIDRINNDGDYEPRNCRWATRNEQQRNTGQNVWLTYKGETKTQSEWSKELGMTRTTIRVKLKKGQSAEEILSHPVRKIKKR